MAASFVMIFCDFSFLVLPVLFRTLLSAVVVSRQFLSESSFMFPVSLLELQEFAAT